MHGTSLVEYESESGLNRPFLTPEIITIAGKLHRNTREEYLRLAGLLDHRLRLFAGVLQMHREIFEELHRLGAPANKLGTYADDLATWVAELDGMMGEGR